MAREGRGLVCVSLTEERCDELDLHPMVEQNTSNYGTAFTVSVEARGQDHDRNLGGRPRRHREDAHRPEDEAVRTSSGRGTRSRSAPARAAS